MGPADRAPFGSAGAEVARRADRGEAHEQFYPTSELSGEITLLLLLVWLYYLVFLLQRESVVFFWVPN